MSQTAPSIWNLLPLKAILGILLLVQPEGRSALAAGEPDYWSDRLAKLGGEERYRIMVDKVWSRSNDWVLTERHLDEIRDASFNVIVPRIGGEDPERVRRVARLAGERKLFSMGWIRGTEKAGQRARLVWEDGLEQDLLSPNTNDYWDRLRKTILGHAQISIECPSLLGTFLDFENYEPDSPDHDFPNCFPISYDMEILADFARTRGRDLPDLDPSQRVSWLKDQSLKKEFGEFQIRRWRERCRELREAIDDINPEYRLIVYPPMNTPFIEEAIFPEWGTERAPLILAEYRTYGRRGWISHAEGLQKNRRILGERMGRVRSRGVFHHFISGIDPLVTGADPEYCGKNASMISEITDGYWAFYEGPTYPSDIHSDYLEWMIRANADIISGSFDLWRRDRESPDLYSPTIVFDPEDHRLKIGQLGLDGLISHQIYKTGHYLVYSLKGPAYEFLKQFDAIILNEYRLPPDDPWTKDLIRYVEEGGGLVLLHDLAWEMTSLFQHVAGKGEVHDEVEEGRYVGCSSLLVEDGSQGVFEGLEGMEEVNLSTTLHTIFHPGPSGSVLLRNCFEDPVCVVGESARGKVAYFGADFGKGLDKELEGAEKDFFLSLLAWISGNPNHHID